MSAFVWLDYSERERRKMLDVVDFAIGGFPHGGVKSKRACLIGLHQNEARPS